MLAVAWVALTACEFDRAGVGRDDDTPDGGEDPSAVDWPCEPWDAANVDPCDPALEAPAPLILDGGRYHYDTDTGVLTSPGDQVSTPPGGLLDQPDGPQVRVLALTGLTVASGSTLATTGSRPLLIIVHGDAEVSGAIDVSAVIDAMGLSSTPGPGGDDVGACVAGTGDPGKPATAGDGGGGGGGGGGYGGEGGDGGDGQGTGHGSRGGKGRVVGTAAIEPLRGGCGGGPGGADGAALVDRSGRAGGGGGGGALEITARGRIVVTGSIAAGGGGGASSLTRGGGGGGGSGGAILLDADIATIAVSAALCANGGGGGEGGQRGPSPSDDGEQARCSESERATGGALDADGGDGGAGGALATPGGDNARNGARKAGGGGGGGGVGRIRVRGRTSRAIDDASVVSPAAAP